MASLGRQSALFGVQDWKRFYQIYGQADFTSYDYETLRKNFIDYLTRYYPESFNDYIESSEYVALLDVMAFMGQALAFRNDLNSRENFIDTAERRDSVIKLANLVSYTPKRNIAGQGLLKVTAVSTTESIQDINGANLSNTVVLWDDPANPNWIDQFNEIINASLVNSQRIGNPGHSSNLLGIITDEYSISIPQDQNPIVAFNAEIDSVAMNFELVNVTSLNDTKLYEPAPAPGSQFNIIYQNDGLGYGSINNGFFFYFKQGSLQSYNFSFTEAIQNNFQQIDIEGINDSDTWLFQTDELGNVIRPAWTKLDNIYTNTSVQDIGSRTVFSVTSRFNDQVTYNFGDGIFGQIPVGTYVAYVRTGNALAYTINPSEMEGIVVSVNYRSRTGNTETLTFTLSLQTTISTAQQRESLTQIKERAPSRFYTQNRMVNGEDYSNYPFSTNNSIIKSKAVNRSSVGISRNLDLLDPTAKYSSVNMFADDGALYSDTANTVVTFGTSNINLAADFISGSLPALLADSSSIQYYYTNFPRYSGNYPGPESIDGRVYWKTVSVLGSAVTGYFYILNGPTNPVQIPVSIGSYSGYDLKYISSGTLLKVVSPPGYYFDLNDRLVAGTPTVTNSGRSYLWTSVVGVIGDGKNQGKGALNDGTGPVKLNTYIPSGCYLDTTSGTWNGTTLSGSTAIIPSLDNTLGSDIGAEILAKVRLSADFALRYDNSIVYTQERWSVQPYNTEEYRNIVLFKYNPIDRNYVVSVRNINYYFGSVEQIRFTYEDNKKIFDPKSGRIINDFVSILSNNTNVANNNVLGQSYDLSIKDQLKLSDGYPDDYSVKVSNIQSDGYSYDPDLFSRLVGLSFTYVFFEKYNDVNSLYRSKILSSKEVVSSYPSISVIRTVFYEYPVNTIFYATGENKFYKSYTMTGTVPVVLELTDVSADYFAKTGRSGLYFQYRHNSSNTTRINPGTTNIIDLYLVTQSYYTQYQNWINDSTGTVQMPNKPTINELEMAYSDLNNYKMISDTMILNSVTFKPLFGTKADPALRGTIKIIKNPNVTVSDSQIRSITLNALNEYFTIDKWDFGNTFYFSELTAYLHAQLSGLISSAVLVPADPNQSFGDLYEIRSLPNEIFVNGTTTNDIIVVSSLTPQTLQRR